jgi:hypothetical protein
LCDNEYYCFALPCSPLSSSAKYCPIPSILFCLSHDPIHLLQSSPTILLFVHSNLISRSLTQIQEEKDIEVNELKTKHNSELDTLRSQNESFIDDLKATHTAELEKIKLLNSGEYSNQIDEMEKANELIIEQIKDESNELLKMAVNQAVEKLEIEHENLISDLRQEYQEILNQTAITEQKNLVLKVGEIKKIYTEHEENSIKSLKLELSNRYLNDIASNNEKSKNSYQININNMITKHETDLKNCVAATKIEYENRIIELNNTHAENLKIQLKEKEKFLSLEYSENVKKIIKEIEEKNNEKIKIICDENDNEKELLKHGCIDIIKNVEEKHEKEIITTKNEHEKVLKSKQLEYECQIITAITNDRDNMNIHIEKATTQLKEITSIAQHTLHNDVTQNQTNAITLAVNEMKKEYEKKIIILIENNTQNIKSYEEKEKTKEDEFQQKINHTHTRHEEHIKNILEEHSKEKNKCVEEAILSLQNKHDTIIKKLYLGYQAKLDELNDALVAEEENSSVKMEEKELENEKKLTVLLAEQNATLCESHKIQLLNEIKESRDSLIAEHNTIINELKNEYDSQQSTVIKDVIESYGKKGRDALEAQRTLFQKERSADLEKSKEEIRILTENHTTEMSTLKSNILKSHQKQLCEIRIEMEGVIKGTVREKEKAAERAVEASSAMLYADKELSITNMRSQHVRIHSHLFLINHH